MVETDDLLKRLPSLHAVYGPLEEYLEEVALAPTDEADRGPELGPVDAYLAWVLLGSLPRGTAWVDCAAERTAGASSLLGLLHPHVGRVLALPGESAQRARAFLEWRRDTLPSAAARGKTGQQSGGPPGRRGWDVPPLEEIGPDELLDRLPQLPAAVLFVSAREADPPEELSARVHCWLELQPEALILVLGLGAVGCCPVLEALQWACPVGSPRRLWLARELGEALTDSTLGIIAPRDAAVANDALARVAQVFAGNFTFLRLLQTACQATVARAGLDEEVFASDPRCRDLTEELNQGRSAREELTRRTRELAELREQLEVARLQLADVRGQLADARGQSEQVRQEFARCTRELEAALVVLNENQLSSAYQIALRLSRLRSWLAPEKSLRQRLLRKTRRVVEVWRAEGTRAVLKRVARRLLGRCTATPAPGAR
jgi:hypothetical protein